jgi:hypothetical protein
MAGLLGQGFDDPRSAAIMALSGGLLRGDMGAGLLGANAAYGNSQNDAMKRQYMQAQMAETLAQAEERKQKMEMARRQVEMQNQFLYGGAPAPSGGTSAMGGPAAPGGAPGGAGGVLALSKQLGIPPEAIQADVMFNGGKKISELLAERSKPNWQNVNGNLVNTAQPGFQGGFQPGMSASSDGRVTAWQPDGQGGLVVGAPRGAQETYGAYQGIQEGTKANFDLQTVTPQGQNPQMTTRGALVRNPAINGRVSPADQAVRDTDRMAILQQERQKAGEQLNIALSRGDQSAAARAQADIAALEREMGGRRPTVGMPLQSEEEKLRASEGVKADAKRNEAQTADAQKSRDTLGNIKQARALLKLGPTSSGAGSVVDSVLGFGGVSTKGADVASQLDTLSGWMVNNVPRMEGPQSNFDVANYKTMAGLVGDRSKPISQRTAALNELERLQQKYSHLNSGGNTGGATGDFGGGEQPKALPQPVRGMVRNGYRFLGGNPADKNSWEKM